MIAAPKAKRLVSTALLLMFALGFIATFSYGMPWDENREIAIMSSNIKEYVLRLVPEDWELYQSSAENALPRISESIERDHGIAVMYPMELLLLTRPSDSVISAAWHCWVYLVYFAGVLALYSIGRSLFSSRTFGLMTALIYFLSPRIFAQGHYNNKDIVLLSLLLCSLALFLSLARRFHWGKLLTACVVAGLLMNCRVVGIALFGLLAVFYLLVMLTEKERPAVIAVRALAGMTGSLLFYYLFTPAMWGGVREALDFFEYLMVNAASFQRWNGRVLFRGQLWQSSVNPLPACYLPCMIAVTTPPYVTVCFAVGSVLLVRSMLRRRAAFWSAENCAVLTALLLFALPIVFAMLTRTKVYNGWRHFYFTYAGMVIVAAYGIHELWLRLRGRVTVRRLAASALALCMGVTALGMALNHPTQFAYYNLLARDAEGYYELDYWDVGARAALRELLRSRERDGEKRLSLGDCEDGMASSVLREMRLLPEADMLSFEADWRDANYVFLNTRYTGALADSEVLLSDTRYIRENYRLVVQLRSYGNTIWRVYEKP